MGSYDGQWPPFRYSSFIEHFAFLTVSMCFIINQDVYLVQTKRQQAFQVTDSMTEINNELCMSLRIEPE